MKKSHEFAIDNWNIFFNDRGISEHLIVQYMNYVETLVPKNLPVIFEVEHLSKLVGIEITELQKMISSPHYFYREFSIPKKRGGKRKITAPYPSLLSCQTWIYENILKTVQPHFCTHAYRETRSIISNATPHLNQKAILKMDLKDFFPSIPINWVINLFSSLGYPHNISYYLASLCCIDGALPQGASTSPCLSNVLLKHFDSRLFKLAKEYKLNYTRYADDLAFSGAYIPHKLVGIISEIIAESGLLVNEQKTSLIIGDKQKIITGLSVKGGNLTLPRASRRLIKQEIHYIKQFGLVSHISKLKIKNPYYLQSLEGKLRFWLQVESDSTFAFDSLNFILSLKKS